MLTRVIIKKIFTTLIYPTSLLALVSIWFVYLLIKGKPTKWPKYIFIGLFISTLLVTSQPLSSIFINSLENDYECLTDSNKINEAQYIVVLGGGYSKEENIPATSQLNSSSLARLIEGMRLKRINTSATLIFSGGNNDHDNKESEAEIYQLAYKTISNDTSWQILSERPHNTRSEADETFKLIGNKPIIIVTTAWHMPRAMYLFKQAGCNAIAAPCDYLAKEIHYIPDLPNSNSIKQFEMAFHEYIGIAAYKLLD
ncbi:MAG: ElyC/SanA/YdcF family protein [Bacteroidota bacterium]